MKNTETHVDSKAVAERAYQLFLARGGEHGHDFDDWVRAEQELRRNRTQAPAPQSPPRPRGKR
ncbi:MAG: DUF2934 domain-containing protein [Deltaproteobacteria bacterium]|nr:DUF2934 domain-containing protein [Deltaproteobacteria bacterium]